MILLFGNAYFLLFLLKNIDFLSVVCVQTLRTSNHYSHFNYITRSAVDKTGRVTSIDPIHGLKIEKYENKSKQSHLKIQKY